MAEEFNFKKALDELKKINEEFDSEEIDLDEALKKFKRGLELAKKCKERLKEIENEVIKIIDQAAKSASANLCCLMVSLPFLAFITLYKTGI